MYVMLWKCMLLLPVSVVLCGLFSACGDSSPTPAPPPPAVKVAQVEVKSVPQYSEWIGTLDGAVNATIRAQVSGYLISRDYREGDVVQTGDLLFRIDPRPLEAVLAQSEGVLAQAEAREEKMRLDVERFTPLAERQAISQQELDDAIQAYRAAQAEVASARAQVDQAKLNLEFTQIHSPIDGIVGIAKAQVGDLVGPASIQELTTVSQVQPIRVYFVVSEREYIAFMRQRLQTASTANGTPVESKLQLILSDGSTFRHDGTFIGADRQVDPRTGAMTLIGQFPNPNNKLRPGQFARVRALTSIAENALLVPQRAVNDLQGIKQVVVMDADNKVSYRNVTPGPLTGSDWIITAGLKAGETVVVEGQQRLRSGMTVAPSPYSANASGAPATAPSAPAN